MEDSFAFLEISIESMSCSSKNTLGQKQGLKHTLKICILIKMFCILSWNVLYKNQKYLVRIRIVPLRIGLGDCPGYCSQAEDQFPDFRSETFQILTNISLFYF